VAGQVGSALHLLEASLRQKTSHRLGLVPAVFEQ
jgi:hypothetical protein